MFRDACVWEVIVVVDIVIIAVVNIVVIVVVVIVCTGCCHSSICMSHNDGVPLLLAMATISKININITFIKIVVI